MTTRPVTFRQADLARALKAAAAAGMSVGRVEIDPDGKIIIVAAGREPPAPANDLDKWMERNARQA